MSRLVKLVPYAIEPESEDIAVDHIETELEPSDAEVQIVWCKHPPGPSGKFLATPPTGYRDVKKEDETTDSASSTHSDKSDPGPSSSHVSQPSQSATSGISSLSLSPRQLMPPPPNPPDPLTVTWESIKTPADYQRWKADPGRTATYEDIYYLGQPKVIVRTTQNSESDLRAGKVRAAIGAVFNTPARSIRGPWLCPPVDEVFAMSLNEGYRKFQQTSRCDAYDKKLYWEVPVYFRLNMVMPIPPPKDITEWYWTVKYHHECAIRQAVSMSQLTPLHGKIGFVKVNYKSLLQHPHKDRVFSEVPTTGFGSNPYQESFLNYNYYLQENDSVRVDQSRGPFGTRYRHQF